MADPITLGTIAVGAIAAGSALTNKPSVPKMPDPVKPPEQPKPPPKPKHTMQDSFLTGVAGAALAPTPRGKTLLGE